MVDYRNIKLSDIMPKNLLMDEKVANACEAIDTELNKAAKLCTEALLISRIDELPEDIIDILAWQWHVDFYDSSYDVKTKRKLIKQSIAWHRRKGTSSVVREVVAAVLNNAEVLENWQYDGDPYHFKIQMLTGAMPSPENTAKLITNLNDVKNVRSHLDEISFYRELNGHLYIGAAIPTAYKGIEIKLPVFVPPVDNMDVRVGIGTSLYKNVVIPVAFRTPKEKATLYSGIVSDVYKSIEIKSVFKAPEDEARLNVAVVTNINKLIIIKKEL